MPNLLKTKFLLGAALLSWLPASGFAQVPSLNIKDAIDKALTQNQSITEAQEAVRQLGFQLQEEKWQRLPEVTTNAGVNDTSAGIRTQNYSIELSKQIQLGGKVKYGINRKKEERTGAENRVSFLISQIRLAVSGAYFDTLGMQQMSRLRQSNLTTLKQLYDRAVERRKLGLGTDYDVKEAETQYQKSEYEFQQVQNSAELACLKLLNLMNESDQNYCSSMEDSDLPAKPGINPSVAIQTALSQRSDLQMMEAEKRALGFATKTARADLMPQLNLSMNYGYSDDPLRQGNFEAYSRGEPGNLQSNWGAQANIKFDVLGLFGRKRSKISAAQSQEKQSTIRLDRVQKNVKTEVIETLSEINLAYKNLHVANSASAAAREAYRLAELQYQTGLITASDLFIKNDERLLADVRLLQTKYGALTSLAQLEYILGNK